MQFNAVVETNTAAVVLWQELGFEIIATVPEAFDHRQYGTGRPPRDVPAPLTFSSAVRSRVAFGRST